MLKKTFDVNQLADRLLELLTDIQNHIEETLTRDGVPLAAVLPSSSGQAVIPKAGLNRGSMVMADDFDEPLPD
ncbi:toxin-antitoxin (TA) system antitoxin [Microcoleus sp. LEGE 07076]|uniref:type II toxin-antitoxin system Phd/YefM family antitoxin n=1 Tax=Microcoleus sp. LEGE 07076 TaxID=915322 RepID=UPI00188246B0|nr:toxin-antitoxin (TA) system antitoxin [Microcoleus sp. LEGE 07076]MBE9185714.1 toxin-antitoxin (TA) system antitoxin [Microcoleus sp. LEGE 07076]